MHAQWVDPGYYCLGQGWKGNYMPDMDSHHRASSGFVLVVHGNFILMVGKRTQSYFVVRSFYLIVFFSLVGQKIHVMVGYEVSPRPPELLFDAGIFKDRMIGL